MHSLVLILVLYFSHRLPDAISSVLLSQISESTARYHEQGNEFAVEIKTTIRSHTVDIFDVRKQTIIRWRKFRLVRTSIGRMWFLYKASAQDSLIYFILLRKQSNFIFIPEDRHTRCTYLSCANISGIICMLFRQAKFRWFDHSGFDGLLWLFHARSVLFAFLGCVDQHVIEKKAVSILDDCYSTRHMSKHTVQ